MFFTSNREQFPIRPSAGSQAVNHCQKSWFLRMLHLFSQRKPLANYSSLPRYKGGLRDTGNRVHGNSIPNMHPAMWDFKGRLIWLTKMIIKTLRRAPQFTGEWNSNPVILEVEASLNDWPIERHQQWRTPNHFIPYLREENHFPTVWLRHHKWRPNRPWP